LDPNIDRSNERIGIWSEGEDIKLKDAVQTHGGKNWTAIAALVPGRTKIQCRARWKDGCNSSIDRVNRLTGKCTTVEDSKLKGAVQMYGGKNWASIAALVMGRTQRQCKHRWKDVLDPSVDQRPKSACIAWTTVENNKLKDAVEIYGGKNWASIAALVMGRTRKQCYQRWLF
jgi:myb proto-oncogene protein